MTKIFRAHFVTAFALLFFSTSAMSSGLTADEQRMMAWIDANTENAIDLLEETVNISSGTMNPEGVRAVGKVMARELEAVGLSTEWIEMPDDMQRAGHLFGHRYRDGKKKILMIGHLDTVFEADDGFQSYRRDGDTAYGPGVEDMKSGNVVIVYALKALKEIGALDDLSVTVAYTGDEENAGSPLSLSKHDLVEAGKWADISLGFEGGISSDGQDWATISRRSSSNWRLEVTGKQAHSSKIFNESTGHGAIFEAARILNEFDQKVRGEEYLTFNAGTIQGGTDITYDSETNRGTTFGKSNVVPNRVIVDGDMRTISQAQLERARAAMREIVSRNLPLTDAHIEFEDRYPPMEPTEGNRRLHSILSQANEDLGRGPMPIVDPSRRGAADISFVAPYSDSLAGMGAVGEGGHTPDESLDLRSMPVAIKQAALLLYRLTREE
ncbi:MAG: M20/M25/M40 family metallo-hydrolase [Gammaproteobacteria bacterium]|nr:M20/M25/M40 family metallo-hydrolase [Gammaproteobacteria bacterium]MDH5241237.1 M20/M25/M40 family metallo-hydrolase [Gammaproteobacteria bacterium]MDH5261506.1 M20/M25/M40 family metallo-hydrolase [Gammaproteobacteria bacterium]MDH5583445.1 M20/M25/M40 family metallo-hydrolase [Gammaproteobacteria bacterium]